MGKRAKQRLVLATSNPGKVVELSELLGGYYYVEPRPPELAETVEDGATLEANAIKKAAEVAAATGHTSLADDSGLFVDFLDGAPGLYTARYAGPACNPDDNMAKLLSELEGLVGQDRRAEFRTAIAVADGQEILVAEGSVVGRIAAEPSGNGGFGYDPIFVPDEGDGLTFAEMTPDAKQQISHRARALTAMLSLMGLK